MNFSTIFLKKPRKIKNSPKTPLRHKKYLPPRNTLNDWNSGPHALFEGLAAMSPAASTPSVPPQKWLKEYRKSLLMTTFKLINLISEYKKWICEVEQTAAPPLNHLTLPETELMHKAKKYAMECSVQAVSFQCISLCLEVLYLYS